VIVGGLSRDKARLDIASELGADHIVDVEQDNLEDRVRSITEGWGVDVSIDTAGDADTLVKAMRVTRKNRTVLFAAAPATTPPDFQVSNLLAGRLTLKPCRGHSYESVELALRYIASGRFPLHRMATHRFGLADVDLAVRSVGGQGAPGAVHVTVLPWS
jgi:threonine dehydrogenase-like Zn-dependent dehydrogenase